MDGLSGESIRSSQRPRPRQFYIDQSGTVSCTDDYHSVIRKHSKPNVDHGSLLHTNETSESFQDLHSSPNHNHDLEESPCQEWLEGLSASTSREREKPRSCSLGYAFLAPNLSPSTPRSASTELPPATSEYHHVSHYSHYMYSSRRPANPKESAQIVHKTHLENFRRETQINPTPDKSLPAEPRLQSFDARISAHAENRHGDFKASATCVSKQRWNTNPVNAPILQEKVDVSSPEFRPARSTGIQSDLGTTAGLSNVIHAVKHSDAISLPESARSIAPRSSDLVTKLATRKMYEELRSMHRFADRTHWEALKKRILAELETFSRGASNIDSIYMAGCLRKRLREVTVIRALQLCALNPGPSTRPFFSRISLPTTLSLRLFKKAIPILQRVQSRLRTTSVRLSPGAVRSHNTDPTDQMSNPFKLNDAKLIILNFFRAHLSTSVWCNTIFELRLQPTAGIHHGDTGAIIDQLFYRMTAFSTAHYSCNQQIDPNLTNEREVNNTMKEADEGMILLCVAILSGCMDVVWWLLRAGVDVNWRDSRTRLTPLHFAVLARSPAMVRMLVENGAIASIDSHTMLYGYQIPWVDRVMSDLVHCELSSVSQRACSNETSRTASTTQDTPKSVEKRSSVSTKRCYSQPLQSDDCDTPSDDEDSPRKRKKDRANSDVAVCNQKTFKFACPYVKFDPVKFGEKKGCGDTGYDSISCLKDHLHKKHRIHQCERCGNSEFENDGQLDDHMTADCCVRSTQQLRDYSKGFNSRQATRIKYRWRGEDPQTKWTKLYRVLFEPSATDVLPSSQYETRAQLLEQNQRLRDENQMLEETIRQLLAPQSQYPPQKVISRVQSMSNDALPQGTEHSLISQALDNESHPVLDAVEISFEQYKSSPSILSDERYWTSSLNELEPGTFSDSPTGEASKEIETRESLGWSQYINDDEEIQTQPSSADSSDRIWSAGSIVSTIPTGSSDDMLLNGMMQKPSSEDAPGQSF